MAIRNTDTEVALTIDVRIAAAACCSQCACGRRRPYLDTVTTSQDSGDEAAGAEEEHGPGS